MSPEMEKEMLVLDLLAHRAMNEQEMGRELEGTESWLDIALGVWLNPEGAW